MKSKNLSKSLKKNEKQNFSKMFYKNVNSEILNPWTLEFKDPEINK